MPWPWIVLPPSQTPTLERVDETLTVVWTRKAVDLERNIATFSEGVQITYGPTTVHADRLVLNLAPDERFGVADGNVRLVDPDGTIDARNLRFDWRLATGEATGVLVRALDVVISAESMTIAPNRWVLIKAVGMPCEGSPAPISLSSPRVVIEPGRHARLDRPQFSLFGLKLPELPTYTFLLDRRVIGLKAPAITPKRGQGVGLSWKSGFLLDDQTGLTAGFLTFPGSAPSYSLEIARSQIPPTSSTRLISPRSDLAERFRSGYFENVTVSSPDEEQEHLTAPRDTLSVGSYWGVQGVARSTRTTFNKPIEVAYERGGSIGQMNGVLQLRAQQIRERGGDGVTRGSVAFSAGPPILPIAKNLAGLVRFDGYAVTSLSQSYGWGQAQLGIVATPAPGIRIGAAYHDSMQSGLPHFEADRLLTPRGWLTRADFESGPRTFSYIAKWNSDTGRLMSREYQATQLMDCFEAYFLFRERPSEYQLGIRLRIDRFLEALQRREIRRN